MLGKLRFLVDKNTAVLIYKQHYMVLPYLDYAGFFTLACNRPLLDAEKTFEYYKTTR